MPTVPLAELADVLQPTIFGKKGMQGTPTHGTPLFSSSEMLFHFPEPVYYVSKRYATRLTNSLGVKEGTILVSRSGTIGLVTIVTADRHGCLVDDHMIRIIPKRAIDRGTIFAFLSSPIGQRLLESLAYGAVQKEIKAFQLQNIKVPRPSAAAQSHIAKNIETASRLRAEAFTTHNLAVHQTLESNHLLPLAERGARPTIGSRSVNAFMCPLSVLSGASPEATELRLEARFHNPKARAAIHNIQNCPTKKQTLGGLAARVFFCNRFTRTFVEEQHGIPYLAGKNIVQIRPRIERYLSISQTEELEDYKLQPGWTLITCSGTIGRTCFVWQNFEKYVATHDLIRVIPDESRVDPGYLYAFLSSPYGYEQVLRFRHGSVVDHVTPEQLEKVLVPVPNLPQQKDIGDKVRAAFTKRAEALKLEDQAQEILLREIKGKTTKDL